MIEGPHWTEYPPDDPPQDGVWCAKCERWECECADNPEDLAVEQERQNVGDPYVEVGPETLDKTEATAQWFDERNRIEAERDMELQAEQRQRELQEATDDKFC